MDSRRFRISKKIFSLFKHSYVTHSEHFLLSSDKASIKNSKIFFRSFSNLRTKSFCGPIILCFCLWKNQTMRCQFTSEVSFVQAEHCWPAASSALPFVPFGSCSCSLWMSALGAGTPSNPGVQPCTLARHNAAPHSQCGLSSGPQGRPRPHLCGCGRGVMERSSCLKALYWLCRPAECKTQGYTQAKNG